MGIILFSIEVFCWYLEEYHLNNFTDFFPRNMYLNIRKPTKKLLEPMVAIVSQKMPKYYSHINT